MSDFHLAQVNIGRTRFPLDSEEMAEFVAALAPINALADQTPGFVWRLATEDGDATSIKPFEDERMIINMSVWESLEALGDYVYSSAHTAVMRRRRQWFEHMELYMALWWIPAGVIPTIEDAKERLEILKERGASPGAFTFRQPYGRPGSGSQAR
ncbi:MAG: DUF3291 domain-containing protein [Dehalococcoidia bacterium]